MEENPAESEWSGFTVTANYQGTFFFSAALNLSDTSEYRLQMISTVNIRHLTRIHNEKCIRVHKLHANVHGIIRSTNDLHTPSVTIASPNASSCIPTVSTTGTDAHWVI